MATGIGGGMIGLAGAVSLGFGSAAPAQPLPADQLCTRIDMGEFIPRATGYQWVAGTSGLILGDSQPDGSFEILLYDEAYALGVSPPESPLIVVGTGVFHVMRPVTSMDPDPIHIFDDAQQDVYEAEGQVEYDSIALTLTTSNGIYYLSGLGASVQVLFSLPVDVRVDTYILAPMLEHGSAQRAAFEADQYVDVVENALNLPPVVPPPGPEPPDLEACSNACQAAYDLAVAIADSNYQTALENCGPGIGDIAGGCAILGALWYPAGGAPAAICCVIGSVPGAIISYLDCKYDAGRNYANALNIAFLTWKACMEGCGFQILEE